MAEHVEDLRLVLNVVDLLGLLNLDLLEDLGGAVLAVLLVADQPDPAEGACLGRGVPMPMVVRIS